MPRYPISSDKTLNFQKHFVKKDIILKFLRNS